MTTESYSPLKTLMHYYGNTTRLGAQAPFNFGLLITEKENIASILDDIIYCWLINMPENNVANWVVSDIIVRYIWIHSNIFIMNFHKYHI